MMDIKALVEAVKYRDNIYRNGVKLSLSFRGNELAGETGEACNILKKLERENLGMAGKRASVSTLAKELADIVMCVALVAMEFPEIDLGQAVKDKFDEISRERNLPLWEDCF